MIFFEHILSKIDVLGNWDILILGTLMSTKCFVVKDFVYKGQYSLSGHQTQSIGLLFFGGV